MEWTIPENLAIRIIYRMLALDGALAMVLLLVFTGDLPKAEKAWLLNAALTIGVLGVCAAFTAGYFSTPESVHKRRKIAQQPAHLLLLPAELRLEIWRHVIPDTTTLSKQRPTPKVPAIAHVRRQTHYQMLPVFYICEPTSTQG